MNNFSDDEQDTYQLALKAYRDLQNVVNTAIQEAEEKAEKKGRELGRQEGRQEVIEQGIQQVVRQMKKTGLSAQDIAQFTGLSEQKIDEI